MFTCQTCGRTFDLPQHVLDRYPGWTPKQCLDCRDKDSAATTSQTRSPKNSSTKTKDLSTAEVLATFHDGPQTGVFTDGAAEGNPGPGGWGAVLVVDGVVINEEYGHEEHTTNNRMELTAMIAGLEMLPNDANTTVYTDSQLVVNILTKWAEGWKERGWKRKTGPIANLELVKAAYQASRARPGVGIKWIKAHSGNRWNEYADALATAYRRSTF